MLVELFKTEERACILRYVMFRKAFRASEVSRATGVTKGLVSRYLRLLEAYDLLEKTGREYSPQDGPNSRTIRAVSYTHLRAHETPEHLVCRLLLEKNNQQAFHTA